MSLYDKVNGQQLTMDQVKNDPIGVGREKGYNIPDSIGNNPQSIAMHLIQTGQVGGPLLRQIMPMIQRMGGFIK